MKRTILVVLAVGLIGGLLIAPDAMAAKKKKKPRIYEGTYSCPCGVHIANGIGPAWRLGSGEGGFEVTVLSHEKKISLEVTDDSGLPVFFQITQDVDGDGTIYEHDVASGCGKSEEPGVLEPGAPIVVFVQSGNCANTGPALATGGTFKATLSS